MGTVRPTTIDIIHEMYNLMEYNACPLAMDDNKYDLTYIEKIMGSMCVKCKELNSHCYVQLLRQLMLRDILHINNLPSKEISLYIVCRVVDNQLWYWGSYTGMGEAYKVAVEIDGVVI